MNENIIELIDLTKKYESHTVVDHLNLNIRKGEVFGLLGPNGAGKSTTILMMLGLTEPTFGYVKVCGINSTSNPIEVKRRVGYLPEDVGFYDDLTGLENLVYTAKLNRMSGIEAKERGEQLLKRIGLSDAATKKAGKYSRGMRQRLGLADVLIKNPEIIILDEPTLGIDPKGVKEFLKLIVELSKEDGLTVLLSSHHLHQVQQICDRVGIFVNGKLLAEGEIHTLSKKLFTSNSFFIETSLSPSVSDVKENYDEKYSAEWLKKVLGKLDGIISINKKENIFQIECSNDFSPDIGKAIVDAGFRLDYLHKKEFGLDDIYYRYFEGGENNE